MKASLLVCFIYLFDHEFSSRVTLRLLRSSISLATYLCGLCKSNLGLVNPALLLVLCGTWICADLGERGVICLSLIKAGSFTFCAVSNQILLELGIYGVTICLTNCSWSFQLYLRSSRIRVQGNFSPALSTFLTWHALSLFGSPLSLLLNEPLLPLLLLKKLISSSLDARRELRSADVVHLLVMNEDLRRQTLQHPNML